MRFFLCLFSVNSLTAPRFVSFRALVIWSFVDVIDVVTTNVFIPSTKDIFIAIFIAIVDVFIATNKLDIANILAVGIALVQSCDVILVR